MGRAIYQVRLKIKSEDEREFNEWYEGTYIPKLMQEVPHFTAVQRYVGEIVRSWTPGDASSPSPDGERLFVTDYETTTEDMELAIAEMRLPERAGINAEFYRRRDQSITLHESIQLHEELHIP